jgi:hypothetical protein
MRNSPPSKTVLVLVVLAALAVIGFVFYTHRGNQGVVVNTVSEVKPLPAPGEWPSTIVRDQVDSYNGSYYIISARYPVTKDPVITAYFKAFIDESVAQFKDDTSWAAAGGTNTPNQPASLSLTITYTEHKAARADNFSFSTVTYTGGAHDLQTTKTFSFSPTGQQISLLSVFTNGIEGLKTVAPYVKAQLSGTPGADMAMINAGTAPTQANYQSFTIEDDGLIFIFDPYQVAPYSAGMQSVKVPLSVFSSIASKDTFATR